MVRHPRLDVLARASPREPRLSSRTHHRRRWPMNTEHFPTMKRPPADANGAHRAGNDDPRDLGLGTVDGGNGRHRLLNTDGTFNVRRRGLGWSQENTLYHAALTLSWPKFFGV